MSTAGGAGDARVEGADRSRHDLGSPPASVGAPGSGDPRSSPPPSHGVPGQRFLLAFFAGLLLLNAVIWTVVVLTN